MADPENSSVQSVISNDDLLTEILVRLPLLSLFFLKPVSKRWYSIIKDAINLTFRPNPEPPCGLFLEYISEKNNYDLHYDFVPLDIRIPLRHKTDYYEILDSCNGLLLGRSRSHKLYIDNPSFTHMFKMLPLPDNMPYCMGGLKMAFDPTKSPHYKVIYAELAKNSLIQLHTYSSQTGNWSICGHRFPNHSFVSFRNGVYWNDAIYWINNGKDDIFKLDIQNEHPVLTALRIPSTLYENVRYECRLFESGGCLLLVGMGGADSRDVSIYEKRNEYSEWSLKYIVNLDDIIKRSRKRPRRLSECPHVFCIVLGEREEDSFLVMALDKKVIQYKIASKTLSTISTLGPKDRLLNCLQFIPSFANV